MKAASDLSSFDHGQGPCCFWYQRPDGSAALWYPIRNFFFPFVKKKPSDDPVLGLFSCEKGRLLLSEDRKYSKI